MKFAAASLAIVTVVAITFGCASRGPAHGWLLSPDEPAMNRRAPDTFQVKLDTTKGVVLFDIRRASAPIGVDHFYNLVGAGYYNDNRIFRMVAGKWAQFGINGTPAVAKLWRDHPIADDPRVESNTKGTIAFAFAVANGRTTQIFINLGDNSAQNDPPGFAVFGNVSSGMDIVEQWYSGYGENAVGGIRAGKQGPFFDGGNTFLDAQFPKMDSILTARIVK